MNDIIKRNKFPIDTTDVLANSGKEGLCPIFDTDIVARRNETNNPISEKGIRNELDKFDPSVTYESVGESTSATFNILHSIEPNKATYNNLLFENGGSGYLNDNVLYLSGSPTTGYQTSAEIISAYISGKCVGGGKYQYCETIELDNIISNEYKIADVLQDNIIGKIFINCIDVPENSNQSYSIGMDNKKVQLTLPFPAPTAEGLVDFCYGPDLVTEHYWAYKDSKMSLYCNGEKSTFGKFGISVFYDKVKWKPKFGYIRPQNAGDTWARFNLNNELYKQSDRGSVNLTCDTLGSIEANLNIYTAGGRISETIYSDVIEKYLTKTDTATTIYASHLVETKMIDCSTFSPSNVYGYFIGGYNNGGALNTISQYNYSTNVVTIKGDMNIKRMYSSCGGNNNTLFIGGGTDNITTYESVDTIEKLTLSTTTPIIINETMSSRKCTHNSFYNSKYVFWNQGINGKDMIYNQDKFDTTTQTIFSSINPFIIKNLLGSFSLQKSDTGYIIGGCFFNGNPQYNADRNNTIQKFEFSNNTTYIVNNLFYNNTSMKYSDWRTTSNSC